MPRIRHGVEHYSLALLEVANLTPALMVADRCLKAAGVRLLGIESSDSADQCIKLVGRTGDVMQAGQAGVELARHMGSRATLSVLPAPDRSDADLGPSAARLQPPAGPL